MGFSSGISERQRRLGEELRRARDAAGLPALEIGRAIGVKGPAVSHIEAGRMGLNIDRLNIWLDLCNVTDPAYRAGLTVLSRSSGKGWWNGYRHHVVPSALDLAEFESNATSLDTYETLMIPGLLQTKGYSEVILGYSERKVEFRLRRQELLSGVNPPPLRAVIHEAALHMMFGGPTVMREQLDHLIEMSKQPNVTIQILPFDCTTYASSETPFMLISGPHARLGTVLLEHPHGSAFIGDPEAVATFDRKFDRLRSLALPPLSVATPSSSTARRDSLGLIQHVRYKVQGR
ncbi:helix-turn-helix transcriptional regulator [Streptomyces sp. SP17BM10]|uniref:helix-turn-helix domain-containing protein n=1 Tax=Streptomyces sp. SP17BM10 TaxID=3002530 RepID=UPI002E763805|nr:helix-turn-helix transcriptional regulator [Streptomyces sp. SP17BM10]MEE1789062.1 helix-turn-helix transcriptional regulator [Streptomyces sp. SP17BM10]